jgi:poly-gamma-glutamate synthesis protein (capsule biosynthesis protein)
MAYDFAFHPDLINELHKYNFGYFTIANNHITNQGAQGIREARQNLLSLDFAFSGCQDGVIGGCTATTTVVKGKRIALLGFSKVYSRLDPAKVRQAISQAQEASDLVIVNIHWGQEYKPEFSRSQQELAHTMAESGADIVIGHHPHVIQGIEVYEGVPIFYSLGNFIFDQYFSRETQQGFGVSVHWTDNNFEIDLLPYRSEKSKIRLMNEQEEEAFLRRLLEISDLKENNQVDLKGGSLVLEKIN